MNHLLCRNGSCSFIQMLCHNLYCVFKQMWHFQKYKLGRTIEYSKIFSQQQNTATDFNSGHKLCGKTKSYQTIFSSYLCFLPCFTVSFSTRNQSVSKGRNSDVSQESVVASFRHTNLILRNEYFFQGSWKKKSQGNLNFPK